MTIPNKAEIRVHMTTDKFLLRFLCVGLALIVLIIDYNQYSRISNMTNHILYLNGRIKKCEDSIKTMENSKLHFPWADLKEFFDDEEKQKYIPDFLHEGSDANKNRKHDVLDGGDYAGNPNLSFIPYFGKKV